MHRLRHAGIRMMFDSQTDIMKINATRIQAALVWIRNRIQAKADFDARAIKLPSRVKLEAYTDQYLQNVMSRKFAE